MTITAEDIATTAKEELTDDGDTLDLDDGRTLRLKVGYDEGINPFDDVDCYGKVSEPRRNRETGRLERPEGFDGNAEKLSVRHDTVWWQPPADVKRDNEGFGNLRDLVRELIDRGYLFVTVELLAPEEDADFYRHRPVLNAASLGGIDSLDNGYLAEVVGELVGEVLA